MAQKIVTAAEGADKGSVLSSAINNLSVNYLTGAYTQLWENWGYENIVPSYNKLYYLKKGHFYFKIDGREYEGTPGRIFLLPFNSVQTYHAYGDENAVKYWIHFTVPCNEKDLLEIISLPHFIEADDPAYLDGLFEKIITYGHISDLESMMMQKSYLFQLLAYYVKKSDIEALRVFKDERFAGVVNFIESHMQQEITLSDLASIAHFNSNYFIKYFKKITGVSPMDYLLNCRVNQAKRLLQSENVSMKEIALRAGFKTPYYFSHVFRERTGFTPTQYRATACRRPGEYYSGT